MTFHKDFLWGGAVAAINVKELGKKVEKELAAQMFKTAGR